MQLYRRLFLGLILCLLYCTAVSAAMVDIPKSTEESTGLTPIRKNLEKGEHGPEKRELEQTEEFAEPARDQDLPEELIALQKKSKIILKAEPGDGLIVLDWKMTGLEQKKGDSKSRFVVFYGDEFEKYEKKLEVGNVSRYTLRNLQNHKTYHIKVEGRFKITGEDDKIAEITIASEEVQATPRPMEEQASPLERSFSEKTSTLQNVAEAVPFKRDLRQFGYEFFKNSLINAIPNENIPVGDDYVIGPGDTLQILVWGSIQSRSEVTVDRNGEVVLPKVGTVRVWGLNLQDAKMTIQKAISRYYKNFELNVTLGRLRSIQVFVVGAVEAPGTYTISSAGTVFNALALAKGPSKDGSLRSIRVTRKGKVLEEIDLYEMFLAGDRSKDIRLENGDTVFVPVIGPVVGVAGEVKRSGIYELRIESSLLQVLQMAGGITAAGDVSRIQVERIDQGKRVVLDFETNLSSLQSSLAAVPVRDRDMVKVFSVEKAFRHVVSLEGNVDRPGEYQFKKGMRISDLISSPDALLPDTYLEAAEIIRLVPPDLHKETLSFNLREVLKGDQKENLLLEEQDTIKVFSTWDMIEKPMVSVSGEVLKPGDYPFYPRMTVRDLLVAAGSLKRNAFLENGELTRISVLEGKAQATRFNINLAKVLMGDPEHNLELLADDVLIVRGVVEWLKATDRFVSLKGEVRFPGIYSINKGETLSSVIRRAGGFTEKAFLHGARFTRKSVQQDQQKRMDEVISRAEQDILKKQGELASLAASREELEATKSALEGLMKSLDKLKTLKAEGRVVIHLDSLEELIRSPYDLELLGGDVLEIPAKPRVLHVMGQVYNPTTFVFAEGKNVSHYLMKAGGPTRDAEENDMYVIKADGSVISRQQSSLGFRWDDASRKWVFGSFMSSGLEQGDTLVVPQKLERIAWLREIKDITSILANIALTAGTVLIGLK